MISRREIPSMMDPELCCLAEEFELSREELLAKLYREIDTLPREELISLVTGGSVKNSKLPPRKTEEDIIARINQAQGKISPWAIFWTLFFALIGGLWILHDLGIL